MLLNLYLTAHNALDYSLRQIFRWRRSNYFITNESKDDLFFYQPTEIRVQAETSALRLLSAYRLETLYQNSTANNYRENLFYIELLEKTLEDSSFSLPNPIHAADIGVSHWFYIQGLFAFYQWYQGSSPRKIFLEGFETDAYRVYQDFFSRYDHALAHIKGLEKVIFHPNAFSAQPSSFDMITLFFPFVFLRDHLEWGLPRSRFSPLQLLSTAWQSVKHGGLLLIVNQGKMEYISQKKMLDNLNIFPLKAYKHHSNLYEYDQPRFVTIARKG